MVAKDAVGVECIGTCTWKMGNWCRWIPSVVSYYGRGTGDGSGRARVGKAGWIAEVSSGELYEALCTNILRAEALNGGN